MEEHKQAVLGMVKLPMMSVNYASSLLATGLSLLARLEF